MSIQVPNISLYLSTTQQDFLIDHVNGSRPVAHNHNEDRTRLSLIDLKLIFPFPVGQTSRPRETRLTDRGREVLCSVLGFMADQLHRASEVRNAMTPVAPKAWEGRGYGYWRDRLAAIKKQEQDNGQKIEGENHERREQV